MNDDPLDPLDQAIGDRLRALAPSGDDTDDALGALRPRARRARNQRRARIGSIAAAFVAVVAIGGALATNDNRNEVVTPGSQPEFTSSSTTTTTTPTEGTMTPTTTDGTMTPGGPGGTTDNTTSRTTNPDATTDGTAPNNSGPDNTGPDNTGPDNTMPGDTVPEPDGQTLTNAGGTIVVRFEGGVLILDSVTPASGFNITEQREDPDRVRVRFRNDAGDDHRIEVDVIDGAMVVTRND